MANRKMLSQLLHCVDSQQAIKHDQAIIGLAVDSRELRSGDLFLALAGHQQHGFTFAQQAQQQGAVAILAETPIPAEINRQQLNIPVYEIQSLSQHLGSLAAYFYDHPSEHIKVTAVTGTNGKTSTAWLLVQALQELGIKAAYMGTLGVGDLAALAPLSNTTPSALHIQAHLAKMVNSGFTQVCLEASSHALVQGRLNG
ncbi:MAG: UDP-N-acetylmuramoyl-L-alanyl-D-glutamate--2,6-diaminopimelate ligase, partial [Proteobacteria bacterium]